MNPPKEEEEVVTMSINLTRQELEMIEGLLLELQKKITVALEDLELTEYLEKVPVIEDEVIDNE